jgi:hypothetical protein
VTQRFLLPNMVISWIWGLLQESALGRPEPTIGRFRTAAQQLITDGQASKDRKGTRAGR